MCAFPVCGDLASELEVALGEREFREAFQRLHGGRPLHGRLRRTQHLASSVSAPPSRGPNAVARVLNILQHPHSRPLLGVVYFGCGQQSNAFWLVGVSLVLALIMHLHLLVLLSRIGQKTLLRCKPRHSNGRAYDTVHSMSWARMRGVAVGSYMVSAMSSLP